MTTTINADTVVGGAVVTADASGVLGLQAAGNTALTLNSSRAVGVGASPNYGTTGQALISAGSSAAPDWGTLGVAGGGTGATSLTANNVLLGNGTSAVQFVAPGTSGNVLTSDGTTWASTAPAGGGSWVYISTTTASSSATIDITSGFTSTYDMYMIVINGMTVSAASTAAFWAQMYFGGSLDTGAVYSYNYGFMDTGGYVTSGYTSTTGDNRMYLAASGIIGGISSPRTINAVFYIANPSSTSLYKYLWGQGTAAGASGGYRSYNFFTSSGGIRTTAMTGVRFLIQSGNIDAGSFRLYGLKKS